MNIWYFCLDPRPTSYNRQYAPSIHIMETICALRAQGHQVRHFLYGDVIKGSESTIRETSRKLSQKNPLLRKTKPFLRDLYELCQNLRDGSLIEPVFRGNSMDMVYERLFHNKSTVSACARKYGIPLIVESNSPAEERKQYWGAPFHSVTKHLEKKVLQRADAITVVSTPLKRYYAKLGIRSRKIFVLPNGVNERRFSPGNVSRDLRTELELDSEVVIGFVGNIHTYHDIELFLPLACTFSSSKSDVRFLIVGAGPGCDKLYSTLICENLERLFTFIGPVSNSQMPNYIAAMDICLLPGFMWYGSPMKICEYGAMGKAIIAPNLENIRDVLVHGETALLFEPGNMPALAQALQTLMDDPHLRIQLGNAARKHILANHTWARNAERIMAIYHQVVSGRM
jgi:glycosyltransferase involved in cell wall biosynthesis